MIKLVTEPIFRPPQEADSVLLHGTQGCLYNKCHFCNVFKQKDYCIAPMRQIKQGLAGQRKEKPADTPVYLSGGNAFSMEFDRLKDIALLTKNFFPQCPRISMYCRIEDIAAKTDGELAELSALGINHLYPGTENGSEYALRLMNKGTTAAEGIKQLKRLESAGIHYTASYILGMAGAGRGLESAGATAEFFNQLKPERISTTGLTVFPDTPLSQRVRANKFTESDEREKIDELIYFIERLDTPTIVDSKHYLNIVNVVFRIPEEKDRALAEIKDFVNTITDAQINALYKRHSFKFI